MENKGISRSLKLLAQLQELHGENPFKVRATANAAFQVDKLPFQVSGKTKEEIAKIPGLGQSMAAKVADLCETGSTPDLEDLLLKTPLGIIEMLQIKGLGPKKISVIWHDLDIDSVGGLYYACNENRLVEAKGFGLKTQQDIAKLIEFRLAANGKFIYSKASEIANKLIPELESWCNKYTKTHLVSLAGTWRRGLEIIESLDFVIGLENLDVTYPKLVESAPIEVSEKSKYELSGATSDGIAVHLYFVDIREHALQLFVQTGHPEHVQAVLKRAGNGPFNSEKEIYEAAGMDFVEPELRENLGEIAQAEAHKLPALIQLSDLKGALHNHSTWSDGANSLEEMAVYCRDVLQLSYLGISDHSKSAFYARGLTEQQIAAQHMEIDQLNKQLAPFRIFKGIESDILGDGSLDYNDQVLASFDFIVASIHSNLKMTEEKATARIIKAVENPYTTILGHPTGRLLLSREGYKIDFRKVIDACAANGVVIEINANPLRLDLDWRWQRYALENGVLLSINPDAHRLAGFDDMRFGVISGRKGGLTAAGCLNAMDAEQITSFFSAKKLKR